MSSQTTTSIAPEERARDRRRTLLAFVLLYVAPWVLYAVLLARQPDDPFIAWHGDVAWPADHFLAQTQGGIFMPIFAHLMIGLIGGLVLVTLVAGVARLLARAIGRDLGGPAGALVLVLAPLWAFAFVKAVPERVTVIDPSARRLEVHVFRPFFFLPASARVIEGPEVVALRLDSRWYKRTGDRFLTLSALERSGESTLLGERPCDSSDGDPCLREGHDDLLRLATWLGRPPRAIDTTSRPGTHFIVLAADPPEDDADTDTDTDADTDAQP